MTKRDELHIALLDAPQPATVLANLLRVSKNYITALIAGNKADFYVYRPRGYKNRHTLYGSRRGTYAFTRTLIRAKALDIPRIAQLTAEALVEPPDPVEIVRRDREIHDLKAQLRERDRLYREALADDTLAKKVTASALSEIKALETVKVHAPLLHKNDDHTPQSAVCLLSCAHFGEVVDAEGTMGLGNYTPALAAARWQYYVESVVDLAINHHRGESIETLHVVNVGDNVSGDIHEELKVSNAFPLGAQIVRQAHLLAYGLRDLAQHFKKIKFVGVVGNHGRFEKKPSFKNKYNNSDWIVYNLVQALVADQKNIEVVVPMSWFHTENIQGHEFFFAHGDNIRAWSGFPWYDAQRFTASMAQVMTAQQLPYPKYWCFGQFHQTTSAQLSYGEWIFTGSWKGVDEYALGKLRTGTPPAQMFFGVHPRRGVSFRYPVVMTDADPNIQDRYLAVADPAWRP